MIDSQNGREVTNLWKIGKSGYASHSWTLTSVLLEGNQDEKWHVAG